MSFTGAFSEWPEVHYHFFGPEVCPNREFVRGYHVFLTPKGDCKGLFVPAEPLMASKCENFVEGNRAWSSTTGLLRTVKPTGAVINKKN